ncbi:MAG: DNA gyrase inhibitor YacG [Steroidobacteraceae bacterium]
MAILISCPHCRRQCSWQDNPWRPFCSERCKLIDLGAWLEEQHAIPGEDLEFPDADTGPDATRH